MNVDGQYNPKDVECISVENLEVLPSGADWQSRHLESERRKAEIRDRIHKQAEQGQKTAKDYFRPAKPTPSIYDSDLKRVAVYARVSTSSEEQISSIENQTLYYTKKIAETENWSLGIRVLLYWMSPNEKQALLQYRFRNVKNLKIYLCQIYRDSLKTYNNRAMRLLKEECRHEFWASYEPASDNSGGKPEIERWERCYPYSWKSGLYLRFAEERSEVYCNHAVCCGASHVL